MADTMEAATAEHGMVYDIQRETHDNIPSLKNPDCYLLAGLEVKIVGTLPAAK